MKQPTILLALLTSGLILACVVTSLAICSQERDLCGRFSYPTSANLENTCSAVPSPVASATNQPTPTLAPPRSEISEQNKPSSNDLVEGQAIFLKIETDQELEVGWAKP